MTVPSGHEPLWPKGRIWMVLRDDQPVWYLCCPGCGLQAEVDDDQLHGRVSIDCPDCAYHETVDLANTAPKIAGPMGECGRTGSGAGHTKEPA